MSNFIVESICAGEVSAKDEDEALEKFDKWLNHRELHNIECSGEARKIKEVLG